MGKKKLVDVLVREIQGYSKKHPSTQGGEDELRLIREVGNEIAESKGKELESVFLEKLFQLHKNKKKLTWFDELFSLKKSVLDSICDQILEVPENKHSDSYRSKYNQKYNQKHQKHNLQQSPSSRSHASSTAPKYNR